MFLKKYKIGEREKILIENILIKQIVKLEEREHSLLLLRQQIVHPKNVNLKLFNTREDISKLKYLVNYLRNLK